MKNRIFPFVIIIILSIILFFLKNLSSNIKNEQSVPQVETIIIVDRDDQDDIDFE